MSLPPFRHFCFWRRLRLFMADNGHFPPAKKPPAGGFHGQPENSAYFTIWFSSPLA